MNVKRMQQAARDRMIRNARARKGIRESNQSNPKLRQARERRQGSGGFTLVELMIVIAIIGVLAALAIFGVRRYLASAKTSEAKNTIGAIARGAVSAYERETAASEILPPGGSSTTASHSLCLSAAAAVPATPPPGKKYQPDPADGVDFNTGNSTAGWKCLKFSMDHAIYYSYSYNAGSGYVSTGLTGAPNPGATGFEVAAQGDLNGDAAVSTFAVSGTVDAATQSLTMATQVFVDNEYE